ncbi:hypothetical protein D3C85_1662500 [compost metagenome]
MGEQFLQQATMLVEVLRRAQQALPGSVVSSIGPGAPGQFQLGFKLLAVVQGLGTGLST